MDFGEIAKRFGHALGADRLLKWPDASGGDDHGREGGSSKEDRAQAHDVSASAHEAQAARLEGFVAQGKDFGNTKGYAQQNRDAAQQHREAAAAVRNGTENGQSARAYATGKGLLG